MAAGDKCANGGVVLQDAQAAYNALAAGLPQDKAVIAVAVGIAESGLCTGEISRTNDWGVWQINKPSHPDWASKNLLDPVVNAQAMAAISDHGTNWRPWVTYTTGMYVPFLPRGQTAVRDAVSGGVRALPGSALAPGVPAGGDPGAAVPSSPFPTPDPLAVLAGLVEVIGKAAAWIANRHNWIRVLEVILGGAAIIAGIMVVSKELGIEVPAPVKEAAAAAAIA